MSEEITRNVILKLMIPEGNSEKAIVLEKFWEVLQELCK